MTRKRDAWTRARSKHTRPKTPAPKSGWLLAELVQLTGLPETTLRYYVQQRVIHPIELRGTATRYDRRALLRLLGVVRLKTEEDSTLVEKKRKLDAMGSAELERWLQSGSLPPAVATALGFESASAVTSIAATTDAAPGFDPGPFAISTPSPLTGLVGRTTVEHWQRIALLPGLELMLRSDAKEPARLAARRICDEYVVK